MKSLTVDDILTREQIESIEATIAEAELTTSAEIRVHLEDECAESVLDHAAFIFEELHMHSTALRNGVLIYVAPGTKQMAVIGDVGIHQKVIAGFWDHVKDRMIYEFKKGDFMGEHPDRPISGIIFEGVSKRFAKLNQKLVI